MYKYFQPNTKDKKGKYGDCVVRALAGASKMYWLDVFDELVGIARQLQCMPNSKVAYQGFLKRKGFVYTGVSNAKGTTRPTVASFTREHKNGTYVLVLANHIVVSENGIYYDIWDSGDKSLYGYWTKN